MEMAVRKVEKKQFIIDGKVLFGRHCSKCGINKPFDEFGASKSGKFGVSTSCLDCSGYKTRKGHRNPLETILINGKEIIFKTCSKCKEKKSLDEFNRKETGSGGVHAECKVCLLERVKENRKRMPKEQIREYRTIDRIKDYISGNRKGFEKDLPKLLKVSGLRMIKEKFPTCALTDFPNPEIEHFIPLGIGHGGNYIGNLYRLNRELNIHKGNENPFEWKEEIESNSWFNEDKWNELVQYLADQNGLTVSEFESFVNWCFDNPRSQKDMKENLQKGITYNSLEEWKKVVKEIG